MNAAHIVFFFFGQAPVPPHTVYRVWLELSAGVFTEVTSDVITSGGRSITGKRGNSQGGPTDLMANIGTLEFWLRNDARPGKPQGWYSPYHASVRAGFKRGIGVKLFADTTPMWRGTIRKILPVSGRNNSQQTYCYATDAVEDLTDTNVKSMTPQIGKTEVELMQSVIATLPVNARPSATSYDAALDVYDYAFYELGGNTPNAKSLLDSVTQNDRGRLFISADGTLTYLNRHTLARRTSSYTFDNSFNDITVADGLDNTYNRVQITQHPKRPTAADLAGAPTIALFSDTSPVAIQPGRTITLFSDYRDPTNTQKLLGAASTVTPLVATTDYVANAAADGSGANVTASVSAVGTVGFSSRVMFVFTNSSAAVAYLTFHQIRGKAIYDDSPITVESYTVKDYGDRLLPLDLKYLSSANVAQDLADFINASFNDPSNQAREMFILPGKSAVYLAQSLTREIGDIVTASEAITGLSSATLMIIGVHFDITSDIVRHWWNVIPAVVMQAWIFDQSRFDVDLVFGYA